MFTRTVHSLAAVLAIALSGNLVGRLQANPPPLVEPDPGAPFVVKSWYRLGRRQDRKTA